MRRRSRKRKKYSHRLIKYRGIPWWLYHPLIANFYWFDNRRRAPLAIRDSVWFLGENRRSHQPGICQWWRRRRAGYTRIGQVKRSETRSSVLWLVENKRSHVSRTPPSQPINLVEIKLATDATNIFKISLRELAFVKSSCTPDLV